MVVFLFFNYEIFNFIKHEYIMLEKEPIKSLVKRKQIKVFKHHGFWKCMDTLRDKIQLNTMLKKNKCSLVIMFNNFYKKKKF